MRRAAILLLAICVALIAPVQAQDDGATRLERFLQEQLSGAGRTVTIRGFRGALSAQAELDQLTISDAEGDWLTMTNAVLDWDRGALLQGRLEVTSLKAERIEVIRRPVQDTEISPEASGTALALPELPVAINIDAVAADEVLLGADLLGAPLEVSFAGALTLADGEGEAEFTLDRIDGKSGRIALAARYSNADTVLGLRLSFDEGPDGIAAGLLGLPGAPPVGLLVDGTGPISDFAADFALRTDDVDRLTGRFETQQNDLTRRFDVAAQGDLRPLFQPSYRAFFGSEASLTATVNRDDAGILLDAFQITTAAMDLSGSGALDPDGLPRQIAVSGALTSQVDQPIVLPLSGPETTLAGATLDVSYDRKLGEGWSGDVALVGLRREGIAAARVLLSGEGTIEVDPDRATLGVDLSAEQLDFGDQGTQTAVGEDMTGRLDLVWDRGAPLLIDTLQLEGESYRADLTGTIANPTTTFDVQGRASVQADDLTAFAGLAGRELSGRLSATLEGSGGVFSGLADVRGAVLGQNLAVGDPRFDPYLAGDSSIELAVRRTTSGSFVDVFRLGGTAARLEARGALSTGSGRLGVVADLDQIDPLYDGISGPGNLTLDARMVEGLWTYDLSADAMSTQLTAEGTVIGTPNAADITASGIVDAQALQVFSQLAGRPISGTGQGAFSGRASFPNGAIAADFEGVFNSAAIGVDQIDPLLEGAANIALTAEMDGTRLELSRLNLNSNAASVGISSLLEGRLPLSIDATAEIFDLARVIPDLTGPALASLSLAEPVAGGQDLSVALVAPSLSLNASGHVVDLAETPVFEGALTANADDLSPFATLLDRPISGGLALEAEGEVAADLATFDLRAEASTRSLQIGIEAVDTLLAGAGRATIEANRANGVIYVAGAEVRTPLVTAMAAGQIGAETAFDFDARLANIQPFVSGLSGAVTIDGSATDRGDGRADLAVSIAAPAGTSAQILGDVAEDGSNADLAITGQAGLALANGIIAPRALSGTARFDLRLDGAPSIEALSGSVQTDGARLIAPVVGLGLSDIGTQLRLANGRANVVLDSAFEGGGRIAVSGPVVLTGNQNADLDVTLSDVVLTDPSLYQTQLNGALDISGPLSGGALISGQINVGETEVRIPSGSGSGTGGLPDMTHINEPAAVRATRARAGLLGTSGSDAAASRPYGLDVVVSAPSQIFVRGRGLDAELGGRLRVRGTTIDVAPDGRLDLIRGRLDILGRRLDMTTGAVTLSGALDPDLLLVAETEAEDVDIEVRVAGRASDPEVTLSSRPDLPEDEILARLLFDRGTDSLSPLQIARLAAAVATLGSSGGGLLGEARSGVGLADLDVTSSDGGGAAVSAGAYLSDNIYTDVTVDTEGGTEVQLNLDLTPSLTVRGRTSTAGESGLGVFFERDY